MATTIIIRDYRFGNHFTTGINGLFYRLPVDQLLEVEDLLADHLEALGCNLERGVTSKGAKSAEEGSTEDLVPIVVEPQEPAIKEAQVVSDLGVYKELEAREQDYIPEYVPDPDAPGIDNTLPIPEGPVDEKPPPGEEQPPLGGSLAAEDDESLADRVKGKLGLDKKKK